MPLLILGAFVFEEFEIPEKVAGLLSGKQMLAVKKQIGGERVIDAMGPDPKDVSWSGRFQGGDVVSRASQLAVMRDAGQAVALTCASVTLTVLIEEFDFNFERPYQGTYEIKLMVLPPTQPSAAPSLDDQVGDDLGSANAMLSTAPNLVPSNAAPTVGQFS